MAGFSSLEIGKRALQAQQYALEATSNNVANVNTPGYSRRTVNLAESSPVNSGGHLNGTGVLVSKLQNYRQEFFDKEVRNTYSGLSNSHMNSQYLSRIESILSEPSENGINELVSNFFNTFSEMAANPEHMGLRTNIISQSKQLAERFNSTAEKLFEARNDAKNEINRNMDKTNTLISEIAGLNKEISNFNTQTSSEAQSLVDKRAMNLEELSKLMEVRAAYEADGSANVYVNGINLITKDSFNQLETMVETNSINAEQTLFVKIKKSEQKLDINNGEIGSLLNQYNVTLDGKDSSGGFSVAAEINGFAAAFAQKVNEISSRGFGFNDTEDTPPGYVFFEPTDDTLDAFSIKLSDDIKGKPENIPLSDRPGEPGNGNIAISMSRLADDNTAINNQSFGEYYANFLSRLGSASKNAQSNHSTTTLILDQLNSQREAVMGVNLDEEAINLVKFQKAFEASSRAITLSNDILNTLINIIR